MTDENTTDTANGDASASDASGEASTEDHGLEWYLHRSAIVTLFVAGLFVAIAFYGSVDRAIEVWIGDRFVDQMTLAVYLSRSPTTTHFDRVQQEAEELY